ncbi:MAG TPA: hypothetical protein VNK46_16235 [Nitrospiraceae bacterium]|nr:hypothetical protein [Nitrospiraceae bacterium]
METVLTPESSVRQPDRLLRSMARDVAASSVLFRQLLLRNLRYGYRQSLLGVTWAFIPPVAIAGAFVLMGRSKVLSVGTTSIPYPAYVTISVILWQTFAEAVNAPIGAVAESRSLLARLNFPCEAVLFAKVAEVGLNLVVKLALVGAVIWWYSLPVGWTVALVPPAATSLILFGTFVGMILAPVGLLYRDIPRAIPILLLFWMFVTPVVVPVPEHGLFASLVRLNPLSVLVVTVRELATAQRVSSIGTFLVVVAVSLVGNTLGLITMRLAMPYVAERASG